MANELLTQKNDDVTIGIHPKNKVTAKSDVTSAGMVGRGKVAPKIDFEISQSWKSGRIDTIT